MEGKGEWEPEKTAYYMKKMTRKQASIIFKTRTRMIKVKGNYKNGHRDLKCRKCKTEVETQQHVLEECPIIHSNDAIKVPKHLLFTEDTGTLKQTAQKINMIMEKLSEIVC